ncbi:response regulator, partial [Singulisphaera rosea]
MSDNQVRVLLVDDDEDEYVLTRDMLAESQVNTYRLEWSKGPSDAIKRIAQNCHDVILVDYRLGPTDGLDLIRTAIGEGCRAPLILLTGQGDKEVDLMAMRSGVSDYLAKGKFDSSQLERCLRYAVWRKRSEDQLRKAHDELEARVRDRTAELEVANQSLRSEIDRRRQAQEAL